MTLFRLDSSIRTEGSVSREVADTVEAAWRQHHPQGNVVRRDIGLAPLPSDAWPAAVAGSRTPVEQRTPEQRQAVALAATLADELLGAQAIVVAAPLYNFEVPAHLKAWLDLVITDPRFSPAGRPLEGRSVILVLVRGGCYGTGTPREGWDHSTPYLLRILGDMWGAETNPRRGRADASRRRACDGRAARRRRRLTGRGPREGGGGRPRARRACRGVAPGGSAADPGGHVAAGVGRRGQSPGTTTGGRAGTCAAGSGVLPRIRSAAFSASTIVGA